MRDGVVVLTHDRDIFAVTIRLSTASARQRGLEFQEVIFVDFFGAVHGSLQKMWRNLLPDRDVAGISWRAKVAGFKVALHCHHVLYSAPLPCRDVFVDRWRYTCVRWLTMTTTGRRSVTGGRKKALPATSSFDDVEKLMRYADEWRSAGLDNAEMAESSEELSDWERWLENTIYCFEQVGDTDLARTRRSSVRFRLNLEGKVGSDGEKLNFTQTELLRSSCPKDSFRRRGRFAVMSFVPYYEVSEMLRKHLISRLPGEELPRFGEVGSHLL